MTWLQRIDKVRWQPWNHALSIDPLKLNLSFKHVRLCLKMLIEYIYLNAYVETSNFLKKLKKFPMKKHYGQNAV